MKLACFSQEGSWSGSALFFKSKLLPAQHEQLENNDASDIIQYEILCPAKLFEMFVTKSQIILLGYIDYLESWPLSCWIFLYPATL